jgi:hypothetical protein
MEQYIKQINEMTLSELHNESLRISKLVLSKYPNTYKNVLLKNEKLALVKERIKELKTKTT